MDGDSSEISARMVKAENNTNTIVLEKPAETLSEKRLAAYFEQSKQIVPVVADPFTGDRILMESVGTSYDPGKAIYSYDSKQGFFATAPSDDGRLRFIRFPAVAALINRVDHTNWQISLTNAQSLTPQEKSYFSMVIRNEALIKERVILGQINIFDNGSYHTEVLGRVFKKATGGGDLFLAYQDKVSAAQAKFLAVAAQRRGYNYLPNLFENMKIGEPVSDAYMQNMVAR